jgi:uncharacterized protein (DUF1330 family)
MPKGYWIAQVDVADPDAYKSYIAANQPIFAAYGARYLVRAGASETVEGTFRSRNVVLEFPSYDAARRCYQSPEYQQARSFRTDAAEGDILIIEGYDGPQPGDR